MDCSLMTAGIEMPGSSADKGVMTSGLTKAGKNPAQAILSDFKKKLESLAAAAQPVAVMQETVIIPGQDNSMAITPSAQAVPQEVVGILEGFGLLDYQTEISEASTEAGQLQTGATESPEATAAQQPQVSGQFARMLNNEQPGEAAQSAQPQASAGAEKYSGSLESTNSGPTAEAKEAPAEGPDAAMLLKSKLTVDNRTQQIDAAQRQSQPQQPVPAEVIETGATQSDAAEAATMPVAASAAATVQAEPVKAPVKDAGKQARTEEKAEMPVAADTSPEPVVSMGTESAKVNVQQAEMPAETTSPQETTTDFVRDNVIRIVDKARASVSEGHYEFDVELKPDFLGKVSIKLTMENGEVRMHVQTEDAAVKGLFSDHSGSLQSALKEKGIVISTVDVSYQDPMAAGREAFGQQSGGNGQRREGHMGWSADRYSGSELFESTAPVSEMLGGSSVEYLA